MAQGDVSVSFLDLIPAHGSSGRQGQRALAVMAIGPALSRVQRESVQDMADAGPMEADGAGKLHEADKRVPVGRLQAMRVVIAMTNPGAAGDRGARLREPLQAEVGDTLVLGEPGGPGQPRIGEITAVAGADGSPPYVVRWLAGDYESTILPGPAARVEKRHRSSANAA
jgi:Domain of unknown function (DUF1918)